MVVRRVWCYNNQCNSFSNGQIEDEHTNFKKSVMLILLQVIQDCQKVWCYNNQCNSFSESRNEDEQTNFEKVWPSYYYELFMVVRRVWCYNNQCKSFSNRQNEDLKNNKKFAAMLKEVKSHYRLSVKCDAIITNVNPFELDKMRSNSDC